MRGFPTFPPRNCVICGAEYIPAGFQQKFCKPCSIEQDKLRKRAFYEKTHPNRKPKQKSNEVCVECGKPFSSHFNGLPYCNIHYQRMHLYGTPNPHQRQRTNTYIINGDITEVTTSNGKTFTIDTADLDTVRKYSWCFIKRGCDHTYLVANINNRVTALHRYLLNPPKGMFIDHINGNASDNRRCNLRICTPKDNSRNTSKSYRNKSGFLGIRITPNGRYSARIMVDRKEIRLGNFKTIEDAVKARQAAEVTYFGEFAPSISRDHN